MTHQEEVSILCEVLFGCFTSVVVYIAADSRTSTASAFMMDTYMAWAAVLNASSPRLCWGFWQKLHISIVQYISVYPGGDKTESISLGKLVLGKTFKHLLGV